MTERGMDYTRGLSLPDAFSCGQLFAFSGMAGENLYGQDWCGMLTGKSGEIAFGGQESPCRMLLRFTESAPDYDVVVPDLMAADGGAILVTFADAQTIVGRSDMLPAVRPQTGVYVPGDRTLSDGTFAYCLAVKQTDAGVSFAFCRRADAEAAEADARAALLTDADALAEQVLDWYLGCPLCPDPRYEKLWFKCVSVNRVNVFSPQDGFAHAFTTPDRLLRRDMKPWDACFHAMAMARYAPAFARDVLLAALECQREDGSIPSGTDSPDELSDVTQFPVLCAAAWTLFEATGDVELLRQTVQPLHRYLEWLLQSRRSPNGLMSRCAQDDAEPVDVVDLSVFLACEMLSLHRIYMALGDHIAALKMEDMFRETAERINIRLWDRQTHCYCDRTWGGAYQRSVTPASFLPMFAGLCDPRQANRLSAHLAALPDHPFRDASAIDELGGTASSDTRRGMSIQERFYLYLGLLRYGFEKPASLLRQKTLEDVNREFCRTGKVDACCDPLYPYDAQPETPEAPPQMCAADSNRSACLIELLLWS